MKGKNIISLAVATSVIFSGAMATEITDFAEDSSAIVSSMDRSDIYIADRRQLADALTGGVLMAENGGSLLTIDPENLTEEERLIIENAENLYILGGESRISKEYENFGNFAGRYSGTSRYETAVKVAENLGTDRGIIIVNGQSYVDATSSVPTAALEDRNVLLAGENDVPEATRTYLEEHGRGKDIIFVGGTASLSPQVKEEVLSIVGSESNPEELTIAGEDRYETTLLAAKRAPEGSNPVLLDGYNIEMALNSANFYDKAPVALLVNDENHENIVNSYSESHLPTTIYTIGQVSDDQAEEVVAEEAPVEEVATEPINSAQVFIDAALEMQGWMYSQSMRNAQGYADCSSLVNRALINSGLTEDKRNLTSHTIWSDPRFTQISFDDLKPGDVLHSPGHLAIYMGDGQVFEAKDWGIPAGYGNYANRGWDAAFRITGL